MHVPCEWTGYSTPCHNHNSHEEGVRGGCRIQDKCSSTCLTVPGEGDCVGRGRRNIRTQLKGQPGSLNPGSSPSEEVTTFFTSQPVKNINIMYQPGCVKYIQGKKMSLGHSQSPGSAWLQCLSHACTLQHTYFT